MAGKHLWALSAILLVVIIVISGVIALSRYSRGQPIEISTAPHQEFQGEIYIGGAVNNPGFYSLRTGDSIENLIRTAGGTADGADISHLKLYATRASEEQPQKVNINRAEAWLLEALPGIGKVRAQAIIDYRQKNGRFQDINELIKVADIGTTSYEQIKHLITVAE